MKPASRRFKNHQSSLPVLPTVLVSVAMVALFVLGSPAEDAGAQGLRGATYHGVTSQGYPGVVKTSGPGGSTVQKASITIAIQCSSGPLFVPQTPRNLTIAPGGRFKGTAEGTDVKEGIEISVFESFSGKFNRQRTSVVTKSRITVSVHAPDGSSESCDSGVVTMHAHS